VDPESEEAPQALQDSSKADGKESAGTLNGEGNGAPGGLGVASPLVFLLGGRVITVC